MITEKQQQLLDEIRQEFERVNTPYKKGILPLDVIKKKTESNLAEEARMKAISEAIYEQAKAEISSFIEAIKPEIESLNLEIQEISSGDWFRIASKYGSDYLTINTQYKKQNGSIMGYKIGYEFSYTHQHASKPVVSEKNLIDLINNETVVNHIQRLHQRAIRETKS